MNDYAWLITSNAFGVLLIGYSLHGCSGNHPVYGWGVAIGLWMLRVHASKDGT